MEDQKNSEHVPTDVPIADDGLAFRERSSGLDEVESQSTLPIPSSSLNESEKKRQLYYALTWVAAEKVGISPTSYCIFVAAITVVSPMPVQYPLLALFINAFVCLNVFVRLVHLKFFFFRGFRKKPALHTMLFRTTVLLSAASFSGFSAVMLSIYNISPVSMLNLMVLGGCIAGGLATLSSVPSLSMLFVTIMIAPSFLITVLSTEALSIGLPYMIVVATGFYVMLGKTLHKQSIHTYQLEQDLRSQREHLAHAKDKAEKADQAKGEFLANMSHELRTPMNAIVGCGDLLKGTELNNQQYDLVDTLSTGAQQLMQVINDILDFSKLESGKFSLYERPCPLPEFLKTTGQLLSHIPHSKEVELVVHLDEQIPPHILIDEGRLRQLLLNLVGNALKFTHKGHVELRVKLRAKNSKRTRLLFEVIDTGVGISDAAQKRIFENFRQADESTTRKYGGTGLGLAISQELVRRMGSVITLESKLGLGSTFRFELDLMLCEEALPVPAAPDFQPIADSNRVLVVDDNPVNRKLAAKLLERLGFESTTAADGQEACDIVTKESFDLILMDCMMPKMDGYEATRSIRIRQPTIPIIALTAGAQPEDRQRCIAAGMNGHLSKPVRLLELKQVLQKHFASTG